METELKLSPVTAAQAERVFSDPALAPHLAPGRTIRMETTWYDTEDAALQALGWTLRLRSEDGRPVCTLKGPKHGLSCPELETPAESVGEGAAKLLARETLPEAVRGALEQPLLARCGARFTRRAARYDDGALAFELSHDTGVLICGGVQGPLCEMELELAAGTEAQLTRFGEHLCAEHGLPVCRTGKKTRALALAEPPLREISPFFAASELLNYCIRCGYVSFRMDEDSRVHYGLTALGAREMPARFGVDFDRPCAAPEREE